MSAISASTRKQPVAEFEPMDWRNAASADIVERIQQCGIVGMGGAGFPTYQKIKIGLQRGTVKYVLANGVESDPGVSSDEALIEHHAQDIVEGLQIVGAIFESPKLTVAVGSRKALDSMNQCASSDGTSTSTQIQTLLVEKTAFIGEERNLIKAIYNIDVPLDQYPVDHDILVFNVATLFAVCEAVRDGFKVQDRMVTCFGEPKWVEIGSNLFQFSPNIEGSSSQDLPSGDSSGNNASSTKSNDRVSQIRTGGSKTGLLASQNQQVQATTNALSLDESHLAIPCIHCGWCNDVCDRKLDVENMLLHVQQITPSSKLAAHYELCYECGACVAECPSKIPILDAIREGKTRLSETEQKQAALKRSDKRQERLLIKQQAESNERDKRMQKTRSW